MAAFAELTAMDFSLALKRYHLRLANEQQWQIIGANRMARLAERLASIMQLEACESEGEARLILKEWETRDRVTSHPLDNVARSISADLPRDGWRPYYPFHHLRVLRRYFPRFRVFLHNEVRDAIFEIKDAAIWGGRSTDAHERRTESEGRIATRKRIEILGEANILREVIRTIYQYVPRSGGLVLHGAVSALRGRGVLLLGRSGAGKSTCYDRFPASWQPMGDEEAVVLRNGGGQYVAHAFPTWSNFIREIGKQSWAVEHNVPLAAVFILQQAESDQVTPIGEGTAAVFINDAAGQMWDAGSEGYPNLTGDRKWPPRKMLFENACAMAKYVPAFMLRVSLTGRFWEEIEGTLSRLPAGVNRAEAIAVS